MTCGNNSPIARLPEDVGSLGHLDTCSRCGDDNVVVVVHGEGSCGECGNEIALCSKHAGQMLREINAMRLGFQETQATALLKEVYDHGEGIGLHVRIGRFLEDWDL